MTSPHTSASDSPSRNPAIERLLFVSDAAVADVENR